MDEIMVQIRKEVENTINEKVNDIKKFESASYNDEVYQVVAGKASYIFKIYKQRTWPEDGKLAFINRHLIENEIGCANISDEFPSVLNHGDLSTKNVMIDEYGDLTLIDWDDAMAINWIADVARMTYWMKFKYSSTEYGLYRSTFEQLLN